MGLGLPILHTEGLELDPLIALADISACFLWNNARQVVLEHRKGKIAVG